MLAAWSALSSGSPVSPASAPPLALSWLAVDRTRRAVLWAAEEAARGVPGHQAQSETGPVKLMDFVASAKPSTSASASGAPVDPDASARGPPVDKVEASLDALMLGLMERGDDAPWPVGRIRDPVASRLLELAAALGEGDRARVQERGAGVGARVQEVGAGDGARVQEVGAGDSRGEAPGGTEQFGCGTGKETKREEKKKEESSAAVVPDGPASMQPGAGAGAQSHSAWHAKTRKRAAGTGGGSLTAAAAHILSSSSSSSVSSNSSSGSDEGVEP